MNQKVENTETYHISRIIIVATIANTPSLKTDELLNVKTFKKILTWCKGTEVGDAGFSLCGGLVKTTKSLSAFLSWFISSLLVDG